MFDATKNTPVELFEEAFKIAKTSFENLKMTEDQYHKLITCRNDIHLAFTKLQYVSPEHRVKLHNKISELQLWALKVGN